MACGYEVQSILHFIKEIVQRCALYVQVSRTGNRGDTTSSTEGMTTPCTSFIQPVKNNKLVLFGAFDLIKPSGLPAGQRSGCRGRG